MHKTSIKLELSGVPATNGPPEPLVTMQEITGEVDFAVSQIIGTINQEPARLEAYFRKIKLCDRASISKYGEKVQRKLARATDDMLQATLGYNLAEVGTFISDMVGLIEKFDATMDSKQSMPFLGITKKPSLQRLKSLQKRCLETTEQLDTIKKRLIGKQTQFNVGLKLLDDLYQQNLSHYQELSLHIMAGQRGLAEVRNGKLANFLPPDASVDSIMLRNDLADWCDSFEERLHDLEVSRAICLQIAPQIRLVQKSTEQIIQRIQSSVCDMLSLWKQQMAAMLALEGARTIVTMQDDLIGAVKRDNAKFITSLKDFLSAQQIGLKYQETASTELDRSLGTANQFS